MEHPLKSNLDEYLRSLADEKRLQSSTLKMYRLELNDLLKKLPTPTDLSMIRQYLRSVSVATQWRKMVIWKAFLKETPPEWSEALSGIKMPKLRSKMPTFLTDDESFRMEAVCYKTKEISRNRLLIGLCLNLGLRISEVLQLKFSDIENQWLKIIRKGGKEQRLPLSPSLQTLIKFWKTEGELNDNDWIFPGRTGEPISPRTAQLWIKSLAKSAGIEKRISPHSLRHTFATQLASRGANLAALKEILGHQRISTTERYLHVTPEHLKETLSLLQMKINPNTPKAY